MCEGHCAGHHRCERQILVSVLKLALNIHGKLFIVIKLFVCLFAFFVCLRFTVYSAKLKHEFLNKILQYEETICSQTKPKNENHISGLSFF